MTFTNSLRTCKKEKKKATQKLYHGQRKKQRKNKFLTIPACLIPFWYRSLRYFRHYSANCFIDTPCITEFFSILSLSSQGTRMVRIFFFLFSMIEPAQHEAFFSAHISHLSNPAVP